MWNGEEDIHTGNWALTQAGLSTRGERRTAVSRKLAVPPCHRGALFPFCLDRSGNKPQRFQIRSQDAFFPPPVLLLLFFFKGVTGRSRLEALALHGKYFRIPRSWRKDGSVTWKSWNVFADPDGTLSRACLLHARPCWKPFEATWSWVHHPSPPSYLPTHLPKLTKCR